MYLLYHKVIMYFYFLLFQLLAKSLFLLGTGIYAVQDSRLSFQLPYATTRNSLLETSVEPRLTMIDAGEIVSNPPPFMDFNMLQYYDVTPDGLVLIHSTGSDSFVLAYSFN